MPDGLKSIFHLAYASNVFNGLISQYTSVDRAEEYFLIQEIRLTHQASTGQIG